MSADIPSRTSLEEAVAYVHGCADRSTDLTPKFRQHLTTILSALASAQALADAAGPFAAACLEMPSDLAPDKIVAHVPAGPRAEAFKRLGAYLTAGNFRDLSSAMVAFQKAGQP